MCRTALSLLCDVISCSQAFRHFGAFLWLSRRLSLLHCDIDSNSLFEVRQQKLQIVLLFISLIVTHTKHNFRIPGLLAALLHT